jgi:hypothetical protein
MENDMYVPPEHQTSAEQETVRHLEAEFQRRGITAEARIVDVEEPHRSEEATTVEVRVSPEPDMTDRRPDPARVVRVVWYDDVPDESAYSALAEELQEEARVQLADR